ncbi:MAG: adenosylmethionine decarboxylase [Kiloniellales bacterium]|nr:adenosylmethionine decarboxylase [Kiloniellales bacterium]
MDRDSSAPRPQGREDHHGPASGPEPKDYFQERDGQRFAGTHLIVDLWDAARLDDLDHVDRTLRACVAAAGATLLHIHLHHFTPNGGVSGVAVLAESHISIHTWPERDYAALDVFMCGAADPQAAIPVLREAFDAGRVEVEEILRGRVAS